MRRVGLPERRVIGGNVAVPAIGGGGPAPAPAFTPTDIAGLVAWFDMKDAAAFTQVADVITSLTNKASSVVWDTGTLPAYAATGFNGFPCMNFNGTTQYILSTEAAVLAEVTNSPSATLIVVCNYALADANNTLFGAGNSAQAANGSIRYGISATGNGRRLVSSVNDAGTTTNLTSAGDSSAADQIVFYHSSGLTGGISLNNAADDPNGAAFNPGASTPDQLAIGARPRLALDTFMSGDIAEMLLYNSSLSAENKTSLYDYLDAKWLP